MHEDVHRMLDALEREWGDAIVADDADRIAAFTTEDWVLVSANGVLPREAFLAIVRTGRLSHSRMDAAGETRCAVHADTATLVGRVVSTATFDGRTEDADEWTTDVWVRTDSGWKCSLTHLTAAGAAPAPGRRRGSAASTG